MKTLDLSNPDHNKIIVELTIMYYANGDVKDIWGYFDGEGLPPREDLEEGSILRRTMETFNLKTEDEVLQFLSDTDHLYTNWDNLTYVLNEKPEQA